MTTKMTCLLLLLVSMSLYFEFGGCIGFDLGHGTTRCLIGMSSKGEVVTGNYDIAMVPGVPVLLNIEDQRKHLLYKKEAATKGRFAFTTDIDSEFKICFQSLSTNRDKQSRVVILDVKQGLGAKKYDELAKAENLKPLEIEVTKLDDLSYDLLNDFSLMRAREDEIRYSSESISSKILYFGLFCMVCLLSLAVWQVMYLKRYFKAKKLIE
ncbi:hypothetical protein ACOME3_000476 [Neoechinorhynchus agilis]